VQTEQTHFADGHPAPFCGSVHFPQAISDSDILCIRAFFSLARRVIIRATRRLTGSQSRTDAAIPNACGHIVARAARIEGKPSRFGREASTKLSDETGARIARFMTTKARRRMRRGERR
jgi:hypothetical protein